MSATPTRSLAPSTPRGLMAAAAPAATVVRTNCLLVAMIAPGEASYPSPLASKRLHVRLISPAFRYHTAHHAHDTAPALDPARSRDNAALPARPNRSAPDAGRALHDPGPR